MSPTTSSACSLDSHTRSTEE
uniref:Uncharacterized protein n=1 Tax=Rhizophora mucronata TaxID=61149 RepID=A0A2P2KUT9_RHIMU